MELGALQIRNRFVRRRKWARLSPDSPPPPSQLESVFLSSTPEARFERFEDLTVGIGCSLNLISLFLDFRVRRTFRPHAAQRGNGNILATMIYGPQIRSANAAAAAEGPRCAARPPRQPTCAANEPLSLYKSLPASRFATPSPFDLRSLETNSVLSW